VTISGNSLCFLGEYEREAGGLYPLGLGAFVAKKMIKHRVEYSCTLRGRVAIGLIKRTQDGDMPAAAGLLAMIDEKQKVLMLINNDGTEIKVMERPYVDAPTFYQLRKASQSAATIN
jgi:hypothetical protein